MYLEDAIESCGYELDLQSDCIERKKQKCSSGSGKAGTNEAVGDAWSMVGQSRNRGIEPCSEGYQQQHSPWCSRPKNHKLHYSIRWRLDALSWIKK